VNAEVQYNELAICCMSSTRHQR